MTAMEVRMAMIRSGHLSELDTLLVFWRRKTIIVGFEVGPPFIKRDRMTEVPDSSIRCRKWECMWH